MAQLIYGSGPDQLMQAQQFYDQYNLGANESNRNAYMRTQQESVDAQNRQNEADRRAWQAQADAQANAAGAASTRDWNTSQAALERASRTNDLIIGKAAQDADKSNQIFNEAAKLADKGILSDEAVNTYAGLLSPEQLHRLRLINDSVKQQVDAATANQNAPIIAASQEGQKTADMLNSPIYGRMVADTTATPLPVSSAFTKVFAGVNPDAIIAPSQHAIDFRTRLANEVTNAGKANSLITAANPITGRFSPAVPMPATSGTGTSPIVPNVAAPVPQPLPTPMPPAAAAPIAPAYDPNRTPASPTPKQKPTRAVAAAYVKKLGLQKAIAAMQADGYDTTGYAD